MKLGNASQLFGKIEFTYKCQLVWAHSRNSPQQPD